MSKRKPKTKRKNKSAVVAKHIVVTAPLKIHLPHEFVAKPIDVMDYRAHAEEAGKRALDLAEAARVRIGPAYSPLMADPISVTDKIAPPWWKFWA
jgi:hypothetical protein